MTTKTEGRVLKLFITHEDKVKTRKSVKQITVNKNGILNDKFYAKDSMRSILITSQESYELSLKNGIELQTGSLGENILIDINPYALQHGDKIKVGNIILEITQNCTLCKSLSTVNSKLPKLLKNDRGIFARVIEGSSEICIDDKIEILNY